MPNLNTDFIEKSFPALGQGQIYLDNAGGSQVAKPVAERLTEYLFTANVQLGASYAASVKATQMVDAGRTALMTMFNAARMEEIVMGATTTQLFDQLARALVQTWQAGDEVIALSYTPLTLTTIHHAYNTVVVKLIKDEFTSRDLPRRCFKA